MKYRWPNFPFLIDFCMDLTTVQCYCAACDIDLELWPCEPVTHTLTLNSDLISQCWWDSVLTCSSVLHLCDTRSICWCSLLLRHCCSVNCSLNCWQSTDSRWHSLADCSADIFALDSASLESWMTTHNHCTVPSVTTFWQQLTIILYRSIFDNHWVDLLSLQWHTLALYFCLYRQH